MTNNDDIINNKKNENCIINFRKVMKFHIHKSSSIGKVTFLY